MSDAPTLTQMSAPVIAETLGTPHYLHSNSPPDHTTATAGPEAEERGRLKRRRQTSLSPRRASSPSRGHDRNSGSRYREHHRKHHRPSSPPSSISPPTLMQKKQRRRSDAEPDHTFRGRVRNRSGSRGRTRSPIIEAEDDEQAGARTLRRRSQPPSRQKRDDDDDDGSAELRRQRSYHKLPLNERRDSKSNVADSYGRGTIT
ncbi:hypothetical protein DE146DRAFT_226887 [Phaeosphaeria sp. MPI-PUGE-AT-0046c]|nr:hypothetical protein DE146DRAFT_226887 [Phaeosphaeria sp. MPI-PUGE-AT-0046c]